MFAGLRRWGRRRARVEPTSVDRLLAQLGPTEEFDVTVGYDGRSWLVTVSDLDLLVQAARRSDVEPAARAAIASETGLRLQDVSVHVMTGDVTRGSRPPPDHPRRPNRVPPWFPA